MILNCMIVLLISLKIISPAFSIPTTVPISGKNPLPPEQPEVVDDSHGPIIGFNCNQTEPEILSVSTLEIEACPELSSLQPKVETIYGQIIQKHDIDAVKIMTCQLSKSTSYFRCGRNWINYNVFPPSISNISPISPTKCRQLHETGVFHWAPGKTPWYDLTANTTYHFSANEVGWTDQTGYCEGGTINLNGIVHKDIVVQTSYTLSVRESWGKVDYSTNTFNIEGVLGCPFKVGSCRDDKSGTHVWTPTSRSCPDDEYRVLYQGPVNITTSQKNPVKILSVTEPPFLFTTELGSPSYVCQLKLTMTEFPQIFFIEQRDGVYQVNLKKPGESDIQFLTYLNSKITYMYHTITDSMERMYLSALAETCKVEREMLRNRIEIIRLNSAAGGLSSLLKPGMFAKVNGEVIHLIKCQAVSVTFRNTKTCYDALPIVFKGEDLFLLPNTHIISPYANQIICSSITPVTYKIGGSWWSYTGSFQLAPSPTVLKPNTDFSPVFHKIKTFAKGGMYSIEQVEAIQKLLIFPQLREAITTDFARGVGRYGAMSGMIDLTSAMSDNDWDKLTTVHWEKVWEKMSVYGIVGGTLFMTVTIFKIIKLIFDSIIDGGELKSVFGWSWKIVAAIWSRLAQFLINSETRRRINQLNEIRADSAVGNAEEADRALSMFRDYLEPSAPSAPSGQDCEMV